MRPQQPTGANGGGLSLVFTQYNPQGFCVLLGADAPTIATMPARTALGSSGQDSTRGTKSGCSSTVCAKQSAKRQMVPFS